ncbi:MAG: hypothetical protein M3P22_02750 [bacterium]|nr:hypothetical protein [bacterium]
MRKLQNKEYINKYMFILNFMLIFLFVVTFSMFAVQAHAQVGNGDIVFYTNPANPAPFSSVTASVRSYVVDLDKALIVWSINGYEKINDIGKTDFYFIMGDADTTIEINVSINTVDGKNINKNIVLTPTNIDMLWEAVDSYSPPFYRGKTLVASEGSFKVVAIPNINTISGKINPNNMSYFWDQDGNGRPSISGWGKSYLTFKNNYLEKENEIKVLVSDLSGKIKSEANITLQTTKPKILFYKKSNQYGLEMNRSLADGYIVDKDGETVVAIPYFFSPRNIESGLLSFVWSLGGTKINTPTVINELAIKPEAGKSGSSKIKVFINNPKTLFQEAEKEIIVNF